MKTKTPPFRIRLAPLVTLLVVSFLSAFAADVPAPSTPTKRDPSQPPEGISTSDWSGIRAAHEAARHAVQQQADGSLMAENPGQRWHARFDGRGFNLTPAAKGWTWGLELRSYGFAGAVQAVTEARVSHEKGRVHYDWDATLREWFINDARGLEQGWTFQRRPAGAKPGEPLRLALSVRGGLQPEITADGSTVRYLESSGAAALTFSGLKAWDADGRVLGVRFAPGSNPSASIHIDVDEEGANYPITIDPLVQQAYLKASNTDIDDLFGNSAAIADDTIVVGAPFEASSASGVGGDQSSNDLHNSGAVYVFVRDGTTWTQQAYIKAPTPMAGGLFGSGVAISGNTIAVASVTDGETTTEFMSGGGFGSVHIYVRDGQTWTHQARLGIPRTSQQDWGPGGAGVGVTLSGDTLLLGAPGEDPPNPVPNETASCGAVHVFVREEGTWTHQAKLSPSNPGQGDRFGATAISGDTIVVGAPGEDSGTGGINGPDGDDGSLLGPGAHPRTYDAGAIYVFVRDGNAWVQQAYIKAQDPGPNDHFGSRIAISGDTILAGNPLEFGEFSLETGAAYVFQRDGSTWTQQARLTSSNLEANDHFGAAVALSGDIAVITAVTEDSDATGIDGDDEDNSDINSGAAYVFQRLGTTWTQTHYIKASNADALDTFGGSAQISGDTVVISSLYEASSATGVNGNQFDNSMTGAGAVYVFSGLGSAELRVKDVSRTGARIGGVPGAEVTLLNSETLVATTETLLDGSFHFPPPAPDLSVPYDVLLEKTYTDSLGQHTVERMYDSVRLGGLNPDGIALPFELHKKLNTQLKKLEGTSSLVLGYDADAAYALMGDWSGRITRTASEHEERDQAMGRLLSASEGMGRAYDAVDPLAKDFSKMVANMLITFLSAAEVLQEVNQAMNGAVSTAAASGGLEGLTDAMFDNLRAIIGTGVEAATALVEIGKDQFIESLKSDVEEPWLTTLNLGLTTIIGGFSQAVSDGSWNRSGFNPGAKKDLLEALAETMAEHVGGRVVASAYVLETQQHLNTAVTRATNRDGDGTVAQGFTASLNKVIEIEQNADAALSASTTAADIAKGWGYVADISQAAGNIPGLQQARALALFLQTLNLTMVGGAAGNELGVLLRTTYTDLPQVPLLAFFPSGVPSSPAPSLVAQSSVQTTERPLAVDKSATLKSDGGGATANALPTDYATALAGLRARIVAGDRSGSLPDLQALLAAHESIHADIQSALLQTKTQAKTASPPRPALNSALHGLQTAGASLYQTFTLMYFDVVGWIIPDVADPTMTQARLLAEIDAVLAAITAFNQAQAAAETEAAGLVTPAYLATTTHGVAGADSSGRIQPGAYTLTARVINTGSQTATGFTAELTAVDPAAPVAVLQITSAASQALADLAPGESRTLTWNVLLTDISTNGTGSGTAYTITLAGPAGTTDVKSGGIRVITSLNTEPLLTLKGANPLVMDARATYTDAGATAYDFQEGPVTPVLVSSNVRPTVPGSYTVTYSATDSTGLSSTVTRNVQVVASTPPAIAAPTTGNFSPLNLTAGDLLPDYTGQAVVSDNANDFTVAQVPAPGTVVSAGTLPVTLTITDGAGNQASLSFDVTVAPAPADTETISGDFPLTPQSMWWHNDLTAHPTNGWLYGACARGGLNDHGMIFRVNAAGDYQTLVHFTNNGLFSKGREPTGRLALGADGNFYGATVDGGANAKGTIFKMTPEGALTTLVSLTGTGGAAMGEDPYGGLVAGPDGDFYGTTQYGGSGNVGTIFKVTPAGVFTTLVQFTGNGASNKGSFPNGSLTLGADGLFYGLTGRGGAANRGTVFKVTTAGALSTLLEFSGNGASNKGGESWGSLTLGTDGDFYGLTSGGGAGNYGTAFKMTPAGMLTTLVEFTDSSAPNLGRYPYGDLVTGADGEFYGVTSEGGVNNYGTVFKLTPGGVLTTLVDLDLPTGRRPKGSLALGADGNFYGTTELGGVASKGTVFKVTPTGTFTTLLESTSFYRGGTALGDYPRGSVCIGPDGSLYGTTDRGGNFDKGTIFKVNTAGQRTVLVHFSGIGGGWPGARPQAGLMLASDGNFYGSTTEGGANDMGTLFRLTPAGVLTTLVEFTGNGATNKGSWCSTKLVQGPDGHLYGMGNGGGAGDYGTIFRMTLAGELTTLIEFTAGGGSNPGAWPIGGLTLGPDGNFYGMTNSGGTNDKGTIFKFNPATNAMTVLVNFTLTGTGQNRGGWPWGGLSFGPDGALYGLTNSGGLNNFGTIFKTTTSGDITTLADFTGTSGATRGAYPVGTMIAGADGFLYGATSKGGTVDMGTLFRMTTGGAVTTLVDFKGAGSGIESGGNPYMDAFAQGADGNLYGMTNVGGRQGGGLIYHVPMLSPEVAVHGNGIDIANNDGTPSPEDHTRFGLAALTAASITRTFTIHNTGTVDLTLGPVLISGAQGADFTVSTAPASSVAPGASTALGITFDPSAAGVRTAHVSIPTNDYDENPFGFFISGIGNTGPFFVGQAFTTVQGNTTNIGDTNILARAWDIDGQVLSIISVAATSEEGATVTRSGSVITYVPPPAFVGIDTFAVTFSDGLATVDGTITMNVGAAPGLNPNNRPQLTAQPGGGIRLAFSGVPGRVYGIQRSTNLKTWTQIAAPTANAQGGVSFDDSSPPQDWAFYRIIFPAE